MTSDRPLPASNPSPRLRSTLVVGALTCALLALFAGVWWYQKEAPAPPVFATLTPTPPIPTDLAPEAVTDPPFTSLTYGIQAFLWWNEATRTLDLAQINLLGFTHVKQRFSWADIQPAPGEWQWDRADAVVSEVDCRGQELVARLDAPPDWAVTASLADLADPPIDLEAWGAYCGAVANRYQGEIAAYQVWNEPNLRHEWLDYLPNAAGYVQLLQTCSQAIRAADPAAIVISAGLAPTGGPLPDAVPDTDFLRQMYDAGASPWFDVLGLNAPGYKAPPEMPPAEAAEEYGHRWMAFRRVEDMRAIMVERGDAAKQVALLEVGWTTDPRPDSPYHWHAVSQQEQADYLAGAYAYAAQHWRPWVGLVSAIYIANIEWTEDDEEYWWAINEAGYVGHADDPWWARPAYFALADMEKVMGETVIPAREPKAPQQDPGQVCEPLDFPLGPR